ncbi:hypothetical protein BDE02_01G135300 [Populus trichocarpa]|nr:hypothetical protein BDE02_01G135300 [Populus trichocarpa]
MFLITSARKVPGDLIEDLLCGNPNRYCYNVGILTCFLIFCVIKTEKVVVKWYYFSEGASESLNHLLFHCCRCLEIGALQALGILS